MWIYGASGHGKVIMDCLEANGQHVSGFIDDDPNKNEFMGFPVVNRNTINLKNVKGLITGIGENHVRKKIVEKLNVPFLTVIHPSATVSPRSVIGEGTVIVAQSVINPGSQIGKHCIINTNASIDHDCRLGDFIHIAPGAVICGNVTIGSLTWIGAGAVIRENLTIGNNVMIGAGSVIVKNIPDNAFVMGVPGRIYGYQHKCKKPDVYIIGASGFGREVECWINQSNNFRINYDLKGFLDDNLNALNNIKSDYKILSKINEFQFKQGDFVLLAISDPINKEKIKNRLNGKVSFLSFISESAFIGKNIQIGEGTIIGPYCVLSSNIKVGRFVSMIIGTIVGHDSIISDFSSLMVQVQISGKNNVGKSTFIGSNSTLIPGIKIGERTKIGAGSIVINDLPEGSFVFGNPAKNYYKILK